jgi:parallel beta-helix repeat protein
MGIMFSRNMFDSVARNNVVSNEEQGIVISESHNNVIYNNTVMSSDQGINVDSESNDNKIYNNNLKDISNKRNALFLEEGAAGQNSLYPSNLVDSHGREIDL